MYSNIFSECTVKLNVLFLFLASVFLFYQLFGNIAIEEDGECAINQHNNFRTFIQALMLLFRFVH